MWTFTLILVTEDLILYMVVQRTSKGHTKFHDYLGTRIIWHGL